MVDHRTEATRSRREEYAAATRQAVLEAARTLFGTGGYVATTVNEIASAARVSPATIYAQCGGKQGLLEALMRLWTTGTVVEATREQVASATSSAEVFDAIGRGHLAIHRAVGDIRRVIVDAAPHDDTARTFLTEANARHRAELSRQVSTLRGFGAVDDSLSDERAVDIGMFFFGPHGGIWYLVRDLGWGEEEATSWLRHEFARALAGPSAGA